MLTCWWLHNHSPIKRLFSKLENSIQTNINYHKTHAMATCFGAVGNNPMENPDTHDVDNTSEDEAQNENIIWNLLFKTSHLRQLVEDRNNVPSEAIHDLEQRLNELTLTLHCPDTPIENVLDRYAETLCTAQKKTSPESSLLQDIPILNGQDSSQLEDWLMDIETASELTDKSRTKLAQVKSRGLVRTLISKALTAQKSWEEIKDSLHLKISNTDIHTSISQFMDIQQTDKESLATYVHRFKWEASRCKFNNDATTIKIFLKGLKNAHSIATKVYKKGPQTLTETIKEVEKLQAAQQITSTLLPTLLVNIMSSNNDRCFQCQEVGHMAHNSPHIWCYDCDNYRHVAMDCPDKIPLSGTPACCSADTNDRNRRSSSRHHSHTKRSHHDYKDRSRFSCSQSCPCNHRYRSSSCQDPHRSCSRSFHRPSLCSISWHWSSSSYHYHLNTPHCRPSSHSNTSRDDSRSWHKSRRQHYRPAQGSSSTFQASSWKHRDKRHKQVTIDDPPSEYYSSDDNDSDSEDDLN